LASSHLPYPDAIRDFELDLVVVHHLGDLSDETARGDDGVAATDILHQLVMLFRLLLLRTDDQEIHDNEDQRERQQRHQKVVGLAGTGGLSKRGSYEHSDDSLKRSRPARRQSRPARDKFARTIAATVPIATPPDP
jgi:hypothetical protein